MKPLKVALAAALLMTAVLSQAQMMMFGGGGGGSPTMLMFKFSREGTSIRDDVSKEIKLTDDQKSKITKIQDDQRQKMMDMFQGGGIDFQDKEAMAKVRKTIGDQMKESEKQINGVLNDDQKKRLRELWIQRTGISVITDEGVQKDLGLSDDQKAKIKSLQEKSQAAQESLGEKMRNQEIDFQGMRDAMDKNNKVMKEELTKVLTTDQAAKLKTLGGAEFKFDSDGGGGGK